MRGGDKCRTRVNIYRPGAAKFTVVEKEKEELRANTKIFFVD